VTVVCYSVVEFDSVPVIAKEYQSQARIFRITFVGIYSGVYIRVSYLTYSSEEVYHPNAQLDTGSFIVIWCSVTCFVIELDMAVQAAFTCPTSTKNTVVSCRRSSSLSSRRESRCFGHYTGFPKLKLELPPEPSLVKPPAKPIVIEEATPTAEPVWEPPKVFTTIS
jgi:hypothetical protein